MEIERWKKYRKALRSDEKKIFDRMMEKWLKHASASGHAGRAVPAESMFLSILLEQQKEIERLKSELRKLKEKEG